jgi:hypothetical protein
VSQLDPEAKQKKRQKRVTNKERLKDTPLTPELVTEYGAELFLSISVGTLRKWRAETPKRYTWETIKKMIAACGFAYPPFVKIDTSIRYNILELRKWISLMPQWGQLPEEEEGQ